MAENWVQIDEAEDVAGSIRHVLRTIEFVEDDALAWKWVMLALHSALQGACVSHLATTASPVGAVTKQNAIEWLAYFEESRVNADARPPKTYLKTLPDLLKAVRKPHSAGDGSNANGVAIGSSELTWLTRFHNDVRNQFTHFEPMGWSLDVSRVPELAKLTARIILEILEMGWAFRHLEPAQQASLKSSLQALQSI